MGLLKVVDFAGLLVAMLLLFTVLLMGSVSGIGVNWGTQATHPLPPATVVKMLRDNGFQTVKLFDADSTTLNALKNSGIQVMVGIPNDMLYTLANSVQAAENWVAKNVSAHVSSNGVDIRYVAVGNEPFLTTYNGTFEAITLPALQNIQSALTKAGLSSQTNGYGNMSIIVGEIGWPTDGDKNANLQNAQRFSQGFMSRYLAGQGTPMRSGPLDAYLFSLIDEDAKSIQPGNFERHWGMFYIDGTPKYLLNIEANSNGLIAASNVPYLAQQWCIFSPSASLDDPQVGPSVSYACANADCTSLGYGTSCGSLDAKGNISYAFNSYYQIQNQLASACQFSNLSIVTTTDPSTGDCKFRIMINVPTAMQSTSSSVGSLEQPVGLLLFLSLFILSIL
nr:glucan endo-1,3-beta-glucosidase 5 [Quercus suber]